MPPVPAEGRRGDDRLGRPMTVRQAFYQATVRGLVEKAESGYGKVQADLTVMRCRFRGGMSGHNADIVKPTRLTRSGHRPDQKSSGAAVSCAP